MTITRSVWSKYIADLRKVNDEAARLASRYLETHDVVTQEGIDALIEYCYGLATKYGEAATELAAQMYDALAAATGATVAPAVPAATATMQETAKAVVGTMKTGNNEIISSAVGRLVKMAGVDTTMQNALRDGAEWAWIPVGDTCAFCITLASRGWQRASKKAIRGGHAEHIHANCDCTYAIRFDDSEVQGYDPREYEEMYYGAEGDTPEQRINSMRREAYARNRDEINAQKRSAYAKRIALNGSAAEEINVAKSSVTQFERAHYQDSEESGVLFTKDGKRIDLGGVEHHVIGDRATLDAMDGGVFTHNHPLDVTFSDTDIENGIVRGNLRELRAVTSRGNLHVLTNNNVDISDRRKFLTAFSQQRRKANNTAIEKIRRGELRKGDQAQYVNNRLEKWLSENSKDYGLEYQKTKVD